MWNVECGIRDWLYSIYHIPNHLPAAAAEFEAEESPGDDRRGRRAGHPYFHVTLFEARGDDHIGPIAGADHEGSRITADDARLVNGIHPAALDMLGFDQHAFDARFIMAIRRRLLREAQADAD